MDLFEDLGWRGLVHDFAGPGLPGHLATGPVTAYIGFDPTAESLHVGNLLQLCNLRRLHEAGHHVIALVGGATGMVGDPGGRTHERSLLDPAALAANLAGVRAQLERLVPGAEVVDNSEWLGRVGVLEFLRDVGKHFTVNQMVAKESVRARFEGRDQGISFTEFSYMLLQAADFLHLFDTRGCTLQLGASDQWGNITMGMELVRKVRGRSVFGLTTPLVVKPDGTKFGKSEEGAVWLDPRLTSPYRLYQFLVRSEDSVVGRYLRYFTWLSREEVQELEAAVVDRPEQRRAQRALAREVTSLVHGAGEADRAVHASQVLFSEDVAGLDAATLLDVFAECPSTSLPRRPVAMVEALVATGLVASRSEARRQLGAGGIYLNNRRVGDQSATIDPESDALAGGFAVLRRGKARHHLVRFDGGSSS